MKRKMQILLCYFIPRRSSQNCYNKMLLANALTSGLRLYQRVPFNTLGLNRDSLQRLLHEDACHYLMYTMIFLSVQPVFLLVIPVTIFAFLHFMSYLIQILDVSINKDFVF